MNTNVRRYALVLALAGSVSTAAFAADRAVKVDDRLDASADVLTDMMRASDKGIPQDLINKARCVVVVPGMIMGVAVVVAVRVVLHVVAAGHDEDAAVHMHHVDR